MASIALATMLGLEGAAWPQAKTEGPAPQKTGLVKNAQTAPQTFDSRGRRDPFKPLISSKKEAEEAQKVEEDLFKRPPLQRFDLASLKLVGIIWGELGKHALVQTPDGKGYLVALKSVIGRNKGEVTAISEDNIVIEERFKTPLGELEKRTFVMELKKKEG